MYCFVKRIWKEVVQKDCQAHNLNKEDAMAAQLRHCDSLGQFKRLLKTYLFGGWDRGAL